MHLNSTEGKADVANKLAAATFKAFIDRFFINNDF